MQVTAEQTDPCTVVLDIEVDEKQVARAFDFAYREFGRHTNIPGFRPGKAPRAVVERYVDSERVRQQALEKIIQDAYWPAVQEQGITPYRAPDIAPPDLEDKKPFRFKATVPLEPKVTLGEYTGLTVEKPLFKVTEEMIDERLERLRQDRARLERVTDRGVQAGDMLIAESAVKLEGDDTEPTPRRQLIQMGSNVPGFDEAVTGMMPGEDRTFELTFPDDFEEEARRGKKGTFTVKLSSLSARRVPELDDEFAKTVGGRDTMDELKEALREQINQEAVRLGDQIAETRLLEAILATSDIHFPEILVREEVNERLRGLARELAENKATYAQYLTQIGRTAEEHQAQLAAQADGQIRTLLALRQIAMAESLETNADEVEAEITRGELVGEISEELASELRTDGPKRLQVANMLVQHKLHDFLFSRNTVNEVEAAEQPETEALEEAGADATE